MTATNTPTTEIPGLRDLTTCVPHLADAGRLGRHEPQPRLLGRLPDHQDRRADGLAGHALRVHHRVRQRHPAGRGRALEPFLAGRTPRDHRGPGRPVPAAGRRQPAALARPRARRRAHGHRRGAERLLGPGRPAGRQAAVAAAGRPAPRSWSTWSTSATSTLRADPRRGPGLLERGAEGRAGRIAALERDGYPAYTTTPGWLGYSDERLAELCAEAVADGFGQVKLKVGARPRGRHPADGASPARRSATTSPSRWTPTRCGTCRPRSPGSGRFARWPAWIEDLTSPDDILGLPGSRGGAARSASPPASTCEPGDVQAIAAGPASTSCRSTRAGSPGSTRTWPTCCWRPSSGCRSARTRGGVGLCEIVQHLSMFDYAALSADHAAA